jgi:hypothetical protein
VIRLADDLVGGTVEETAEVMAGAIQPPKYKLTELGSITYAPFVKHEAYEQTGITAACELGCDQSEERFQEALRAVAKPNAIKGTAKRKRAAGPR